MSEAPMHEHISDQLKWLEFVRSEVMQAQKVIKALEGAAIQADMKTIAKGYCRKEK